MVLPKVGMGANAYLQGKQGLKGRIALGDEFPGARRSSMRSCLSIPPVPFKALPTCGQGKNKWAIFSELEPLNLTLEYS